MHSRNGPQALRERSGAGDGVARGGAPHKTTILVSKLLEASRNGTQALRGAERRWVRCGAGRGATQTQNHIFLVDVSKVHPLRVFFETIAAHVSLSTTDV